MDGIGSMRSPLAGGIDLATPLASAGRPHSVQAQEAAATGFESMFASLLLKQMRESVEPGGGLFGNDPGEVLGGLFDHFMGQHIAQQGRLGIADLVKKQWFKPS